MTKEIAEYNIRGEDIRLQNTNGENFSTLQVSTNLGVMYQLAANWSIQLAHKYYLTRINTPDLGLNEVETSKEHIHAFNLGVRCIVR